MPTISIPFVSVRCCLCGRSFDAETDPELERVFGKRITATICDPCAAQERLKQQQQRRAGSGQARVPLTAEQRRRERWIAQVGVRYADFRRAELPAVIQPHADRVLAWQPQPRGIGLLGPSRTGKSPLLYALAMRLACEDGRDVFPTSGIEFQRAVHRSVEHRAAWERYLARCQDAAILLIDDADKLNLTPGVEAEYYGMLEHRRNWQRPVLCTLNLCGDQIKALGRDRTDRAPAIVERLRDLCEFTCIPSPPGAGDAPVPVTQGGGESGGPACGGRLGGQYR